MIFANSSKIGLVFTLVGCLLACQSNKATIDPDSPAAPPLPGVPTAVGKPIGNLISKTIGPTGGTLTSTDGAMTLTFPAGALQKETVITAQPMENTAFGGAGSGYEFGPHGTQFAKPVTMSWTYKPDELQGSSPDALGIAFQDDKNVWQGHTNLTVNTANHQVSAPIYHFSRYSFYENFWMEPDQKILAPNETVELAVFYQENHGRYGSPGTDTTAHTIPGSPSDPDDIYLVALRPAVKALSTTEVKNWRVNGQDVTGKADSPIGLLSYHEGKSVIYKAPAKVPENNPMAVSVEVVLKGKGKLLLISNFTIESPNELYINGSKHQNTYVAATVSELYTSISLAGKPLDGTKQPGIFIQLIGVKGPSTVTLNRADALKITMNGTDLNGVDYADYYVPEVNKMIVGPGSLTITEFDLTNQVIAGSFSATLHHFDRETKDYKSMKVSGKFRSGGS